MCKECTILIEQCSWRYTAQCEHGTIHLRWDNITLSLQPDDFVLLVKMVCEEYYLLQPQSGRMRLNIGPTTLEFSATDFHPLMLLMRQTAAKLDFAAQQQEMTAIESENKLAKHSKPFFPFASQNTYLN